MNPEAIIKLILMSEMMSGNTTIRDVWHVDLVAGQIMASINYLPVSTPMATVLPIVAQVLDTNGIRLGVRPS